VTFGVGEEGDRRALHRLALEEVGLFDYLAASADETARRLLPTGPERARPRRFADLVELTVAQRLLDRDRLG
jgi:hypothetical protein